MTNKERLELNNAKIEEIQQTLNGKILSVNQKYIDLSKQILNGTLEEFDNTIWGLTTIERYKFYNFFNLGKVKLGENITEMYEYAFYKAGQNAENPDFEIDVTYPIGNYCFAHSGVTKAKINTSGYMGQYSFYNCKSLKDLDITIPKTQSFGAYLFMGCDGVEKFRFNSNSNVTALVDNMFYELGFLRPNPENNVFVFDLRKSTFVATKAYAFYKSKYFDIFMPTTCTTIASYTFGRSENYNVYFTSTTPATLNTNTFAGGDGAKDYKIFVPYNNINTYKTATNWVTHADYIYGWAEENTFEQGAMLPKYSAEGYELTWYSDKELTTQVTNVADVSKIYYCIMGDTQVDVVKINSIITDNANVSIVDTNGIQYKKRYYVPVGANLTISVSPINSDYVLYTQTINGVDFTSPYGYTTIAETNIDIIALYWNGVDLPLNLDFAQNDWAKIKSVIQSGKAGEVWSVGDVKEIEIDGLTYGVRLADLQQGRYDYADGTRKTNAVLEFVQLYNTNYAMNKTVTNAGGWGETAFRTTLNTEILAKLPAELQELLEEVVVASANGASSNYTAITTSNNKLFLPSAVEVNLSTSYGYSAEGTIWDYYIGAENILRIKMKPTGTAGVSWWLRSPNPGSTGNFSLVTGYGSGSGYSANYNYSVCPCFAW